MNIRQLILVGVLFLFGQDMVAQSEEKERLLLDAVVLSADSLLPVANSHVISKYNRMGTISDDQGRFKMYVDPHDSLLITSVGFSPLILYITDSLWHADSIVPIIMAPDTIMINEIIIRAFYDYEVFKQMVVEMKPIDLSQFYPQWEGTELLYQDIKPMSFKGPIQALYDQFNHLARLQRRLIRNREQYNALMIRMGRFQDTIPAIPEHMQELPQ